SAAGSHSRSPGPGRIRDLVVLGSSLEASGRRSGPGIRAFRRWLRPTETSRAWALKYEHLDGDLPERVWTTDVGIEPVQDRSFRVSVRVAHSLRPTFVGREPASPESSAPRLALNLLSSELWHCTSGSVRLSPTAHVLAVGRGHLFHHALFDDART